MKEPTKTSKGILKGTPSAVLISMGIHIALFMLAGMLVVFTVVKQNEVEFEPPKAVERPKMKLKKPKVRVRKSSKPKPTTRIVTKVQKTKMPDIQLPEISGIGEGLSGAVDGFDMMPDLSALSSPFGGKISTGSELEGYFYNFNRDRNGRKSIMSPERMVDILADFMKSGWKSSKLARFYRAPEVLYAPTICVPTVQAELAPESFGMPDTEGYCWAVLYTGSIVYPEDIRFRFWGVGDKVMAVNVDGKTVLICAYLQEDRALFSSIWDSNDPKDNTYYFGEHRARPSDWITLKGGEAKEIQVLLADTMGGLVYHILSVEVEGQDYPRTRGGGGPTFPVFKTAVIPQDMRDVIYSNLYPGDTTLTNGPIFNDFSPPGFTDTEPVMNVEPDEETELVDKDAYSKKRVWKSTSGKSIEAKFRTVVGKTVILEGARRKQIKIPFNQLSSNDQVFVEYATPPVFDINFFNKSAKIPNPPLSPWVWQVQRPLQMFNYTFGVKMKQTSTGEVRHKFTIEYFAVGSEVDGDNFVLLDRGTSSFIPSEENNRSHEFEGEPVKIMRMAYRTAAPMRGTKYKGYLVTVKDEQGKIIQYKASNDFLFQNLKNLTKLHPNNHFNRDCVRVIPARPTEDSRGPGAVRGN